MAYKKHMIEYEGYDYYAGGPDGFRTYCGLDESCSDAVFEKGGFVNNGNAEQTTCKRCLSAYKKSLALEDAENERMETWARSSEAGQYFDVLNLAHDNICQL